jgi:zinc transporter ZupT
VAVGQRLAAGLAKRSVTPAGLVAGIQAFAAGAILVMLTDEMIPGAHQKGHTAAGWRPRSVRGGALLSFNT